MYLIFTLAYLIPMLTLWRLLWLSYYHKDGCLYGKEPLGVEFFFVVIPTINLIALLTFLFMGGWRRKIKNNLGFIRKHENFDLPLEHYYVYGGKKVDAGYKWILGHLELRRKQLKEYYEQTKI